uniref:C2H2-type domain-containing protein n=1 Tax=Oryza punctata TaxID=4537 RepID=A0A0E0KRR8_ORYPU
MDSRGQSYYLKAAAAAAAAGGDATDHDEEPAELAPKAVPSKKRLVVEAQGAGGAAAMRDDLTCPECGKVFLSDKAMYGHLRAHPLRKHKGVARPAAATTAADDAFVAAGVKARPWKVPRKEEVELDDRHPGRSPVTGKRGRPASSASSSGSAPAPPASSRLQLVLTEEEEAAMTLLDIASGRSLDHQPTQPAHVADGAALPAPASHQMPSDVVEQDANAVAAPGVQQHWVPDHVVAGADEGQRRWEAEKPALVEHVFGIVREHVVAVTADAEPQTPEANTPVKLGPVTDQAAPVLGDKNGNADMPVSPGGTTKKPLKRRIQDVERSPTAPPPPVDFKPPLVRRIPSPASKRKYECSECHKTFSSHQALGGHVAAHKRQKKSCVEQQQHEALEAAAQVSRHNFLANQRPVGVGVVVDAPVVAAGGCCLGPLGEEGLVGPPPPPTAPAPAPPQHQCVRCPMIFPTGQALGGHMRKHFLEAKEQEQALASASANANANAHANANATPAPPPMMANTAPAPPPMMANAAPVPPTMANGAAPVPPPIAVATPPAPPIARAAPPPPMANGAKPATPVGTAAAAPPAGNAAPAGPQPGVNLVGAREPNQTISIPLKMEVKLAPGWDPSARYTGNQHAPAANCRAD